MASARVCHAWGDGVKCLGASLPMLNFDQGAMPHDLVDLNLERIGQQGLQALRALTVPAVPIA